MKWGRSKSSDDSIRGLVQNCLGPPKVVFGGAQVFNLCSAVSYFSTLLGSIIGAGRLSFRVRDGTGRFPAAMAAVTLCKFVFPCRHPVFGVGVFWWWGVVCGVVARFLL